MEIHEKPLLKGFSFTFRRNMKYRVKNIRALKQKEFLDILHRSAEMYSEYVDTTLLFIFREKKDEAYEFYEVRYGKNNFMHLAGIKSDLLNANEFYEACIAGTITVRECKPRRDINTMYSKVAIIEEMLNLRNSKCYKIGKKNLVTYNNDFEMATGNSNGVIGYDSRIKVKGVDKVTLNKSPIPTTLLNNSITDYCTRPQKIIFILQKQDGESKYNCLFYEIKKGLFQIEKESFSDELKDLIGM